MLASGTTLSLEGIVRAVRTVVGDGASVGLHEPTFKGAEWKYVKECLDTGWVSTAGAYVGRFEKSLCEHCEAQNAVAVVSGTAALHAALLITGVEPGDEVIVPSLTFAATANAVVHCGAIPHFVDSNWESLGMDAARLDAYLGEIVRMEGRTAINRLTGRALRAIVPVDVFGHSVDLDAIEEVAGRFNLALIEDATEALGSRYRGRAVGGASRLAVLSFNGNKIVTTGGGGAILTNDADTARHIRHMTTTAKLPHRWAFEHDAAGYNYRMPNINAALGVAQLEQLDGFIEKKRRLAERYQAIFAGQPGVSVFREPSYCRSNYWLNALILDEAMTPYRDDLLNAFHAAGLQARPVWRLLHELPHFSAASRMPTPVADDIQRRIVNLPSSPHLVTA